MFPSGEGVWWGVDIGALPGHVCEHNLRTCHDITLSDYPSHKSGMQHRLPPSSESVSLVLFQSTAGLVFQSKRRENRFNNNSKYCLQQFAWWKLHTLFLFCLLCFNTVVVLCFLCLRHHTNTHVTLYSYQHMHDLEHLCIWATVCVVPVHSPEVIKHSAHGLEQLWLGFIAKTILAFLCCIHNFYPSASKKSCSALQQPAAWAWYTHSRCCMRVHWVKRW